MQWILLSMSTARLSYHAWAAGLYHRRLAPYGDVVFIWKIKYYKYTNIKYKIKKIILNYRGAIKISGHSLLHYKLMFYEKGLRLKVNFVKCQLYRMLNMSCLNHWTKKSVA